MRNSISYILVALLLLIHMGTGVTQTRTREAFKSDQTSANSSIKIGVFLPLTEQLSVFGIPALNGIKMATDEVNSAGGINGKRIELLIEDDRSDSAEAATIVTKFVEHDNVHAILGEVASSKTMAATPIAQRAGIPLVTPSSTNPEVTRRGDFIFRTCFIDPVQGAALGQFAVQSLKAKRAALMIDKRNDYSDGLAHFIRESFEKFGGQIVSEQKYAEGDQDFNAQLTAIKAGRPDVIFIPGYYAEASLIAQQARKRGIKVPLLGGDGWNSSQLLHSGGRALIGSYFSDRFTPHDTALIVKQFVAAYQKKYNALPDASAAEAYDAARILFDAIRRAGTSDGAAIRDALAQTFEFQGVTGTITINAERNADKEIPVLKIESDGNAHFYQRVRVDSMSELQQQE